MAEAVSRLGQEVVDWRFKGMPPDAAGRTVAELAAERRHLLTGDFSTPLLTLDGAAVEHNIRLLARYAADAGMRLAPHGKTSMAPALFARQLAAGAWGLTAATLAQARVYRAFGVGAVLLANEVVDPVALRWLAAELDADPSFQAACYVDSTRGVELMAAHLTAAGARRPVDVIVEVGGAGGRTGVRSRAAAREVAAAVAAAPSLRLAGVGGYEGALAHDASGAALGRVANFLDRLVELARECDRGGLFAKVDQVIVSAGGSAYFDLVAAKLGAAAWRGDGALSRPVLPLLRSGAYVSHDDGFYAELSPLTRDAGRYPPLRPALLLWGRVLSRPEPGLALLDFGRRDASFDLGMPMPRLRHRPPVPAGPAESEPASARAGRLVGWAAGEPAPVSGLRVTALNDQHAFVEVAPGVDLQVGDWLGCGLSHPCTVFDKWQLIPLLDESGHAVEYVRTFF